MSETILVTGATGTVGTEVVKALRGKSVRVRAAVHSPTKSEALRTLGAEPVELDLERHDTLAAALNGADRLMLITPFSPAMIEQNVALAEGAKRAGVRHIVKLSAIGTDAEPGITVGRWHRAAEKAVEATGIPFTHLRPNFFMQNLANFFGGAIRAQGAFTLPAGEGRASFVDAADIGAAAAGALTSDAHFGRALELTGPQALSYYDLAALLSEALGRKVTYMDLPADKAREGMLGMGMPEVMVQAMLELYGVLKAGYTSGVGPGVESLAGRPPRSFHDYLEDHLADFR